MLLGYVHTETLGFRRGFDMEIDIGFRQIVELFSSQVTFTWARWTLLGRTASPPGPLRGPIGRPDQTASTGVSWSLLRLLCGLVSLRSSLAASTRTRLPLLGTDGIYLDQAASTRTLDGLYTYQAASRQSLNGPNGISSGHSTSTSDRQPLL